MIVKPEQIIEATADYFGIGAEDVTGTARHLNIVRARRCAIGLTRQHCQLSYPQIGEYFGLDHTTVVYHVRKIEEDSARYAGHLAEIEKALYGVSATTAGGLGPAIESVVGALEQAAELMRYAVTQLRREINE